VIVPVTCAVPNRPRGAPKLSGRLKIRIQPGSRLYDALRQEEIEEDFLCNFELNGQYQSKLENAGLRITGFGKNGEARAVELPNHRFFLATLFLPQHTSEKAKPHPLIVAYLRAAAG